MLFFKCQNPTCNQEQNILPDDILSWINSRNRRVFKCPLCMGRVRISMRWSHKNSKNYLPINKCQEGYLYLIVARNAYLGIYKKEGRGFYINRQKFNLTYIDIEYHWDTGEPFGTVCPYFKLIKAPKFKDNNEKLNWLNKMKEIYQIESQKI